ncbi:MAG TPA: hypothetical protein PLP29_03430 [Candidatus Ozemobacteraceae bacterium]|nr:hypothetical protein [Candidatus Ozemobacteraceae bacterium]
MADSRGTKSPAFVVRAVVIPALLLFALNHFWFGFTLIRPFPRSILVLAGIFGLLLTAYEALTGTTKFGRPVRLADLSPGDFSRLKTVSLGDVLANVVFSLLVAYVSILTLNGLIPLKSVGRDTTVIDITRHVSRTKSGGSSETHQLVVDSWDEKGKIIVLDIDRTTGLKLNKGAPIHIDTRIGLLGLEFYRSRHQSFTFRNGYRPPFAQPAP